MRAGPAPSACSRAGGAPGSWENWELFRLGMEPLRWHFGGERAAGQFQVLREQMSKFSGRHSALNFESPLRGLLFARESNSKGDP